jgi:hypothetical protein
MHGCVSYPSRKPEDAQKNLRTFGIQISGLKIEFFTLYYLNSLFFRLHLISFASLPSVWNCKAMTSQIIDLIMMIINFRERISIMSNNVVIWNGRDVNAMRKMSNNTRTASNNIIRVPTLTTPVSSPKHQSDS